MQPSHSLYTYKDLSLDHNLNQVSVFCTLIPCVIVMLIQVVSSLACVSHFPTHIQYVTILIHFDFIAFIIYDKGHKFWSSSLSSSHFLSLSTYSHISLFSNTLRLHSSLRVENNLLYVCKRGSNYSQIWWSLHRRWTQADSSELFGYLSIKLHVYNHVSREKSNLIRLGG
jgi:hypothetical protein